jgi:hypothetical protein
MLMVLNKSQLPFRYPGFSKEFHRLKNCRKGDIANYLTPISLAYWLADDGAKHGKGLMLNTNSYEKVQVELLSSVINQTFGFSSSVYSKRGRNTTYYTIYISSKDMPKLRALV